MIIFFVAKLTLHVYALASVSISHAAVCTLEDMSKIMDISQKRSTPCVVVCVLCVSSSIVVVLYFNKGPKLEIFQKERSAHSRWLKRDGNPINSLMACVGAC